MKTQIIQLEIHDDTISVRDKMDWSQTPRILLVWPERGKVFQNRLDLILLERYCSSHGSQLALLTTDPEVEFHARKIGIPVFHSRKNAQLQPWRKSSREFKRTELQQQAKEHHHQDLYKKPEAPRQLTLPAWARMALFTAGALSVLSIAALLLPSAKITLQENITTRELIIPVQADPETNRISISGIVPAREMTTTIMIEQSREATGTLDIPNQYAEGYVIFTNLTENSIEIPENTILSTSSEEQVLFTTEETGTIPPGVGEQIYISIRALEAGSGGNVPANQINRVSQEFGADLSVLNPEPTSGGTNLQIPAPSQADRTILSSILDSESKRMALNQFYESVSGDDVLFESSLFQVEIEQETSLPPPGSPGESLTITRTAIFGIQYAAGEDLSELARETIQARLRNSSFEMVPDSLEIENNNISGLMTSWDLSLTWQEVQKIPDSEIIQLVLGKSPQLAKASIQQSNQLLESPQISLSPQWWFRLPVLPFRISIVKDGG